MTLDPRVRGNDEQKSTWLEPSRLRVTPLRKCLKRIIDYRGKTPKKLGSDWADKGYRALSAINVKDSGLTSTETIRCVDAETYKKWMKEEVKRGDILLTSEAPAGEVMIWDSDEKIVLSQRLFCLRTNKQFDNRFIKYYLQSPAGKREVNRTRSGSTVAGISAEMFDQIQVLHPETVTQQKIASVLSALDAKIDLNKRINAELEALAKTIYDYWFVQFDFPDAHGRPYKSSGGAMVWNDTLKREIPAGWEANRLEELGALRNGINYDPSVGGDATAKIINVRNVSASTAFVKADDLDVLELDQVSIDKYLVTEDAILIARSGIPGATRMMSPCPPNTIYCGFIICLTVTDPVVKNVLFFRLKQIEGALLSQSSGSILKNVSQETLKDIAVALPASNARSLLRGFDDAIQPLFRMICMNSQQSIELTHLRDWLLPLLMNGQVRVA